MTDGRYQLLEAAIKEYEHRDNPGYEHMQTLLATARERLSQLPKPKPKTHIYYVRVALNIKSAPEEDRRHFVPYLNRQHAATFAESLGFRTYSSVRIEAEEVEVGSKEYNSALTGTRF